MSSVLKLLLNTVKFTGVKINYTNFCLQYIRDLVQLFSMDPPRYSQELTPSIERLHIHGNVHDMGMLYQVGNESFLIRLEID